MATLIINLNNGTERRLDADNPVGIADLQTIRDRLMNQSIHTVTVERDAGKLVTIYRQAVTDLVWIP